MSGKGKMHPGSGKKESGANRARKINKSLITDIIHYERQT